MTVAERWVPGRETGTSWTRWATCHIDMNVWCATGALSPQSPDVIFNMMRFCIERRVANVARLVLILETALSATAS